MLMRAMKKSDGEANGEGVGADLEQQMMSAKAHLDSAEKRRGKVPEFPDPLHLRVNHRIVVSQTKHAWSNESFLPTRSSISNLIFASKNPFNRLRRVSISELRLEMANEGRYVIIRVLEKGFIISGWTTVIEDHLGTVCLLGIYNYPSNELFRVGTILIIKEPYFKIAQSGYPCIRCDCPTDIIVLKHSHPLYYLAKEIQWSNELAEDDEDPVMKPPEPKTAEGWKDRGNFLYKIPDLVSAREAYLLGLKICQEKNLTWKLLKLNLAAVFLELGYFEDVIAAVSEVLKLFPDEKKALLRAGKAHYRLRQYDDAFTYFGKYCKLYPDDSTGNCELTNTKTRLEEQRGQINIPELEMQSRLDPLRKLECADYVGPVKVVDISGKGRGLVATKDIKMGTLLMVSKALASTLNPKATLGFEIHANNSVNLTRRSAAVVSQLTEMLMKNPKTYDAIIYNLSTGENPRKNVQLFCDPDTKKEPICDVEVIKAIDHCNAFGIYSSDHEQQLYSFSGDHKTGGGLFVLPSFMNHSCTPNVFHYYYNDVLVIYSAKKLKAGEEILTSYVPINESYEKRSEMLKQRGFICHCIRCKNRN